MSKKVVCDYKETVVGQNPESVIKDNLSNVSETQPAYEKRPEATHDGHSKWVYKVSNRLHQLSAIADRYMENLVRSDQPTHTSMFWWMIVKPDVISEYQAQLDDNGKEELNNVRFFYVNDLFWMLVFIGWSWVYLHRLDILSFSNMSGYMYINRYIYQSLIGHWEWVALVCLVYCFGARRRSESTPEQLARVPGLVAVAIVVMTVINGVTGFFLGAIPGSLAFTVAGVVLFIAMCSIIFRISESEPEISITEEMGVLLGLMLGVLFNIDIYNLKTSIYSGAMFCAMLISGVLVAKAIKAGQTWIGKVASIAFVISWLVISLVVLWDSLPTLFTTISTLYCDGNR